MVDIVNLTGMTVTVPDSAINVVSGPYPGEAGVKSYVRGGFGPGAIESNEDASHFVDRLQTTLARLTRPNGTPVWVKASAITILRFPFDTEILSPPNVVRSVIIVGGFHQALQEDMATVRRILAQTAPALFATPAARPRDDPSAATNEFFLSACVSKTAKKKAAVASKKRSKRIKQSARAGDEDLVRLFDTMKKKNHRSSKLGRGRGLLDRKEERRRMIEAELTKPQEFPVEAATRSNLASPARKQKAHRVAKTARDC